MNITNFKRTLPMIIICMLIYSVFSAVMVYAPRPEDGGIPFQNVIITNSDPIAVTLDETIEVTNPTSESLNVAVPDGVNVNSLPAVEVTNTLDVSGWLHTTKSGDIKGVSVPTSGVDVLDEETDGYRQVTLLIHNTGAYPCGFVVSFRLPGPITYVLETLFIVNPGTLVAKTYDVQGTDIILRGESADMSMNPGIVDIHYFITT